MIEEKYLTLLKEFGTDSNPHSGDVLINHLSGTHDLLQAWGDPQSVCLGGLFHSIYGTQSYHLQSASLEERDAIRAVIGTEAEELAFLFSVTQRRHFFTEFGKPNPQLFNRLIETYIPLAPETINQLLEMEMANYAEFLPREQIAQKELDDFAVKVELVRSAISKRAYQTISELLEAKKVEAKK